MKLKAILILISIFSINSALLRREEPKEQKELNPESVKSPGGFDNVAPDAKKIITAELSSPKVDIDLKIRTMSVGQRSFHLGATPLPKVGRQFDPSTGTFNTVPYVDHKQLIATTTTWAPTENLHTVQIDMNNGKAIPALNTANQPKALHGTDPKPNQP